MITIYDSFVGKVRLLQDRKKRIIYVKEKFILTSDIWLKDVSFYLDGVSFVHNLQPMDKMRTCGSRACQQKVKDCA